ncbi:hypothetical protein [Devosia sp.]|uniref:hypothetical protein n=1 Tax=Devosia sp. TaxID=1871048 RepID=UPI0026147FC0|nr:hypothetical protein [Devosia sp.]
MSAHTSKAGFVPQPTDLAGKPYTPARSYSWLTDAWRADYAAQFEVDPSQVEAVLDNRDAQLAWIAERLEYEDPFTHHRQGARPLSYAEKVF